MPGKKTTLLKKKPVKKTITINPYVSDDDEGNENIIEEKVVERKTSPHMNIFEWCAIISKRVVQLEDGDTPLINGMEGYANEDIAVQELRAGALDMSIERELPGGRKEEWHVRELKLPYLYK